MIIINPYVHVSAGGGSLPEKADLETLDYAYHAEPFVNTGSKSAVDLTGLDYTYHAEPFVGND